ncbi:MAG TPA: hypothetical protein VIY53_11700 [Acidobacteriaceae bacterium]
MRMACLGVLLVAGSAAMGQTASTQSEAALAGKPATSAQPLLSLQQSLQVQATLPSQFFRQNPQNPGVLRFQPGSPTQRNWLTENQPLQLIGPPAGHAQADVIPIPTQWPHAKMEAIPTRWPDLKFVPVKGAAPAIPGQ